MCVFIIYFKIFELIRFEELIDRIIKLLVNYWVNGGNYNKLDFCLDVSFFLNGYIIMFCRIILKYLMFWFVYWYCYLCIMFWSNLKEDNV